MEYALGVSSVEHPSYVEFLRLGVLVVLELLPKRVVEGDPNQRQQHPPLGDIFQWNSVPGIPHEGRAGVLEEASDLRATRQGPRGEPEFRQQVGCTADRAFVTSHRCLVHGDPFALQSSLDIIRQTPMTHGVVVANDLASIDSFFDASVRRNHDDTLHMSALDNSARYQAAARLFHAVKQVRPFDVTGIVSKVV